MRQHTSHLQHTLWVVLGLFLALMGHAAHAQDKGCFVVLMHGKWGNPQYISHFGRKMEPVCAFKSIELPWSQRRNYDAPYPKALEDIQAEVRKAREQGYAKVVLAGHSFGANAAMAYMAEMGDADAVIALAPGHSPAHMYERGIGKDAVDQARALVASGKGDQKLTMDDLNQGKRLQTRMSADALWTYFNPEGLGHMPGTAAKFKKPVPFAWVIGTADPLFRGGQAYAFDKTPPHPKSLYLVVEADHANTPDVAAPRLLEWLKGL